MMPEQDCFVLLCGRKYNDDLKSLRYSVGVPIVCTCARGDQWREQLVARASATEHTKQVEKRIILTRALIASELRMTGMLRQW